MTCTSHVNTLGAKRFSFGDEAAKAAKASRNTIYALYASQCF